MGNSSRQDPDSILQRVDTSEFFFPGSGVSALLIHGLTGTPYEMRFPAQRLASAGVRVRGVRLAGHARTPEDLALTGYDDWYQSVVGGFAELRGFGDPVVVVGLSLGAVLAARLALDQREGVAGIAMLSSALFLDRRAAAVLTAARLLGPLTRRIFLNSSGSDIHDEGARRIHPSARRMALSAPISLLALERIVRPRISGLTQPALIVHSHKDHTCPYDRNVEFLMGHIGSAEKRLVELSESYHVITVDTEKERVAAELVQFVERFRADRSKLADRSNRADPASRAAI
jgi:carboxylesterase